MKDFFFFLPSSLFDFTRERNRNRKTGMRNGSKEGNGSKGGTRVTHTLVPDHANESRLEDTVDGKQLPIIDIVAKVKGDPTACVAPRLMSLVPQRVIDPHFGIILPAVN